jgi:hypothetical protein
MKNIYISLSLYDESDVIKLMHVISFIIFVNHVTSFYVDCTQHSTQRSLIDDYSESSSFHFRLFDDCYHIAESDVLDNELAIF